MKTKIAIAFCIDTTYTQHLGVAIASLLKHNKSADVTIYVASSLLPESETEKIASVGRMFGNEIIFKPMQEERYSHRCTQGYLPRLRSRRRN